MRVIHVVYSGTDYSWRAMSDYAANGGTTGGNDTGYGSGSNGADAPITIPGGNPPVGDPGRHPQRLFRHGAPRGEMPNADRLYDPRGDDDCGYTSGPDPDTVRWGYCPPWPDYHLATEALARAFFRAAPPSRSSITTLSVAHPISCNFAMCDGSVRR